MAAPGSLPLAKEATCNANRQAYALLFISGLVNASAECTYDKDRGYGRSVRLVKDIR